MRNILEMENPTINVYPIFANPLAVMQSHQETNEWILCNFIDGKYGFQNCTFQELDRAVNNIDPDYEPRSGFKGNIELIEWTPLKNVH